MRLLTADAEKPQAIELPAINGPITQITDSPRLFDEFAAILRDFYQVANASHGDLAPDLSWGADPA